MCHRESPHPTHRHRSPVQQAPNSHGVRTFILGGRLHRHLQQGRCRSRSSPTSSTYTAPQGVRPPTRSGSRGSCPLSKEEPQTLVVLRQHTFGSPSPPFGVLTTDPEKVLALARATFQRPRGPPQQQSYRAVITCGLQTGLIRKRALHFLSIASFLHLIFVSLRTFFAIFVYSSFCCSLDQ